MLNLNNEEVEDYLNSLMTNDVPLEVQGMIKNLSYSGKRALVDLYNPNSKFHKHGDINSNVLQFGLNTNSNTTLYHYTSVSSLEKILESGYFRIKASGFMNDPDEFKWASTLSKEILSNIGASDEEIDAFNKMIDSQPFKDAYIWSFTKNSDSQSLFATYGNKDGVALEFSLPMIMKTLAQRNSHGKKLLQDFEKGDAYTFPLKVEYNEKIQKSYLEPITLKWLLSLRAFKEDPFDMKNIMLTCSQNISLFNMAFKNPLLYQEEEIRFIVLYIGESNIPELEINGIPYTRCELKDNLIRSVKLQKGNKYNKTKIADLLKKTNNHIQVMDSNLPY